MFVSIFKTCWRVFCRKKVRNYFITGLLLFQLKGKKNEFAFIQNLVNYCVKVSVNNLRRKWIKKSFRKLVETIRTWIPLLPWKTFFFTVNKRTVNRWHLRNFFSILAWKYIFSLSFLFLSLSLSLSLSFLLRVSYVNLERKLDYENRSWAMKMMKLDWPSRLCGNIARNSLSLSLSLSFRMNGEARGESSIFRIDFSHPPSMEFRIFYCPCHCYNSFFLALMPAAMIALSFWNFKYHFIDSQFQIFH